MKYILNEKFKLVEKYTLHEDAENAAIITDLTTKVLDKISALLADLNANKTDFNANKTALDELEELSNKIKLTNDSATLTARTSQYIQSLKKLLGLNNFNVGYDNLRKEVDAINPLLNRETLNKTQINDIHERVELLHSLVTELNSVKNKTNQTESPQEILKTILTETNENVVIVKNNVDELTSTSKNTVELKNLLTQINADLSHIKSTAKLSKDDIVKYTASCKQFNDSAILKSKTIHDATRWEDELKKISGPSQLQQFWDNYFKIEFDNKITSQLIKVRLEEEIEVLGFSATKNPFIRYLHDIINTDLFKVIDRSSYAYNELHNAVARHQLSYEDLKAAGPLKNINLIYCADLFAKAATDIKSYFALQHDFLDKKTVTKKIKSENYADDKGNITNQKQLFVDLFYRPGSILLGNAGNINSGVRSLENINNEFAIAFGERETKEEVTSTDSLITEWGLDKRPADEIKSVIVWLLNRLSSNSKQSLQANYQTLRGLTMNDELINTLQIPAKFGKKQMTDNIVRDLIVKLGKQAQLIK